MTASEKRPEPVPRRWERPFNFPPGIWKQQLAEKYRQLAVRGDLTGLEKLLDEGTRAELSLPMQEQAEGIGSGHRVRRRSATVVARSLYYAWRIAGV